MRLSRAVRCIVVLLVMRDSPGWSRTGTGRRQVACDISDRNASRYNTGPRIRDWGLGTGVWGLHPLSADGSLRAYR